MRKSIRLAIIICSLLSMNLASAQEIEEVGDVAKQAQNPLANIISLPFQNNTNFGYGEYNKTGNTLNIQPILPFAIGEKGWVMMNRFIIPLPHTIPDLGTEDGKGTTGLGDINYTVWFAPPPKGSFTWGFGVVTIWPTASKSVLGSDKISMGPSFVLVNMSKKWMLAAVISEWSSVGGNSDADDVNIFYFQYIVTRFLEKKWYVTSAPIITANFEAEKGQQWTFPIGAGVGKMFNLGKQPMDFTMQTYYNVATPDGGPDWQLRAQLKFIFAKGKK